MILFTQWGHEIWHSSRDSPLVYSTRRCAPCWIDQWLSSRIVPYSCPLRSQSLIIRLILKMISDWLRSCCDRVDMAMDSHKRSTVVIYLQTTTLKILTFAHDFWPLHRHQYCILKMISDWLRSCCDRVDMAMDSHKRSTVVIYLQTTTLKILTFARDFWPLHRHQYCILKPGSLLH